MHRSRKLTKKNQSTKINKSKNNRQKNSKKYKSKSKKSLMCGGVKGSLDSRYMTIPNSGFVEEERTEKYNQCFWISIRDYLNNYRGLNVTVGQIKRLLSLPPTTDRQQMDYWETPMYKQAVDSLATLFDLRIEFYYMKSKKPVMFDVGRPDIPVPQTIVNDKGTDIVPIAFTGGHYELIVSGPNIEPLVIKPSNDGMGILEEYRIIGIQPSQSRPIAREYEKKYLQDNTYVPFSQLTPKKQAEETIKENEMLITFYESEMKKQQKLLDVVEEGIAGLPQSSLSSNNKRDSGLLYQNQKKIHQENLKAIQSNIDKLRDELQTMKDFIRQ